MKNLVVPVIIIIILYLIIGVKKINEGYVGITYRFGVLQQSLDSPGYHLNLPFMDKIDSVQITVQTDQVQNIPCGTSGGVMIQFDQIEVVNQLSKEHVYQTVKNYGVDYDKIWIYDKIHHEINQFCSKNTLEDIYINKFDSLDDNLQIILSEQLEKWVPGLKILSIRITKPSLPTIIKNNFEKQESLKTELLKLLQQKNVEIQNIESANQQNIIQAQSDLEVTKIQMKNKIQQKQNELEVVRIQNEIFLNSEKSKTDGMFYQEEKELELLDNKLTSQYLDSVIYDSLLSNLDLYLGDQIPQYLMTNNNNKNDDDNDIKIPNYYD